MSLHPGQDKQHHDLDSPHSSDTPQAPQNESLTWPTLEDKNVLETTDNQPSRKKIALLAAAGLGGVTALGGMVYAVTRGPSEADPSIAPQPSATGEATPGSESTATGTPTGEATASATTTGEATATPTQPTTSETATTGLEAQLAAMERVRVSPNAFPVEQFQDLVINEQELQTYLALYPELGPTLTKIEIDIESDLTPSAVAKSMDTMNSIVNGTYLMSVDGKPEYAPIDTLIGPSGYDMPGRFTASDILKPTTGGGWALYGNTQITRGLVKKAQDAEFVARNIFATDPDIQLPAAPENEITPLQIANAMFLDSDNDIGAGVNMILAQPTIEQPSNVEILRIGTIPFTSADKSETIEMPVSIILAEFASRGEALVQTIVPIPVEDFVDSEMDEVTGNITTKIVNQDTSTRQDGVFWPAVLNDTLVTIKQ